VFTSDTREFASVRDMQAYVQLHAPAGITYTYRIEGSVGRSDGVGALPRT
jgi:hypothetical protein